MTFVKKKSAVNITRTSLQVNTPTKTFGLGKVSFNEISGVISMTEPIKYHFKDLLNSQSKK